MKKVLRQLFILICLSSTIAHALVLPGIDQLTTPKYIKLLKNKRVALLTNSASRDSHDQRTIEVLSNHSSIELTKIFTPEHGLTASLDHSIKSGSEHYRGLPVISLYGKNKAPTLQQLAGIDVLVFDLQPVGVRFYTYISTLALTMQQMQRADKPMIILDRPNPQGGTIVTGPITEQSLLGDFIAYYPLPMQYGLTIGELGKYYQRYFGIDLKLTVVPMRGWRREMLYNQTELTWSSPSPALPSFKQAFVYGVFGPLEALQLSVARGQHNDHAFIDYGAPYISKRASQQLVQALNTVDLPGLRFETIAWTPDRAIFKGQQCHGFRVIVKDYSAVRRFYSLLVVLRQLHQQFGKQINMARIDKWIGASWVRKALVAGKPLSTIMMQAKASSRNFVRNRDKTLLYS